MAKKSHPHPATAVEPVARPGLRPAAWVFLVVGGLVGATLAACSLNPQPLPPVDDERATATPDLPSTGGGTFGDADVLHSDASSPPNDTDAGADATTDATTDGDAADAATTVDAADATTD